MHGAIFMQLKDFVVKSHGMPAWDKMLELAGMPPMAMYLPSQTYPDADMQALVQAACTLTGKPADAVLEAFGVFIAPQLMQMYRGLIDPSWKTLDLLLNVEDTIHRVVRTRNKGAEPPQLRFARLDEKSLNFHYDSPRHIPALARGIMLGVAREYGEIIEITQTRSTPAETEMVVRLVG